MGKKGNRNKNKRKETHWSFMLYLPCLWVKTSQLLRPLLPSKYPPSTWRSRVQKETCYAAWSSGDSAVVPGKQKKRSQRGSPAGTGCGRRPRRRRGGGAGARWGAPRATPPPSRACVFPAAHTVPRLSPSRFSICGCGVALARPSAATAIRAEREILINLEKRRRWQSCTSPLCRVAGRFGKRRECGTDRERCRLRRYRARPGDMAIALRQRHLPPNAVAYKDDRRGAGCGATLPRPGDLPTGARHHPTEECARAEADDVLLCSPAGNEEYVALHGTITAHRSPARAEHNTSLGGV